MPNLNISRIKESTIAIGLIDKNNKLVRIKGSGVIVDPDGYFITASHVIENCKKEREKILQNEGIKTWIAIASYISVRDAFRFITNPIGKYIPLSLELSSEGFSINFDIAIGILKEKEKDHPYNEIGNKTKYNVMDEIFMCGYPGGHATLKPDGKITDITFSPVIQHGRISALMPADNATTHHGIITDIIGTGGSSGSPIVDAKDSRIIGIAQTVIPAGLDAFSTYNNMLYTLDGQGKLVEKETERKANVSGYAKTGLVVGVSNTMFGDVPKAIEQIKGGATAITGLTARTAKPINIQFLQND